MRQVRSARKVIAKDKVHQSHGNLGPIRHSKAELSCLQLPLEREPMSFQNNSDTTSAQELHAISDSIGHDEELPLNFSENSAGSDAANLSETGGESSVASASFNFINTIVGAGVIGIPFSIYQARKPLTFAVRLFVNSDDPMRSVAFLPEYSF